MSDGVSPAQKSDPKDLSPDKLEKLLAKKTETEEVLNLLEDQLYKFEGDLLKNSFYGSILSGWNRPAFSIVPSRAQPSILKRSFQEDERILSRSSVDFMKRRRREAGDQENRLHPAPGRVQKMNTSVGKNGGNNNRSNVCVIKAEPRSPSPEYRKSKFR
ncbi:Histone acetyltransferase subunit NuA4 [Trichostrongylus colubriformis]|uniref:Chromatin modification-related protein MEAF6 n=1 Tax=Trichostrongylus colubriformis TaxID=6319 RepID=A0AAN8F8V8_TRICO